MVNAEEATEMAKKIGALCYLETSCTFHSAPLLQKKKKKKKKKII
jgi:hypothetical protein